MLITPELKMNVGFNCPDSAMLYWNKVEGLERYRVYGLGERYMTPLFDTPDSFCVLRKPFIAQNRFAVAPVVSVEGNRSAAPDLSSQGVGCYFSSFWGELLEDRSVLLRLSVGTDYGIKKVVFQKIEDNAWRDLVEYAAAGTQYIASDGQLRQGKNRYRCALHLTNGGFEFSDPVDVYASGTEGWAVFPNPVSGSSTLNVVTDEGEGDFLLFDLRGATVAEFFLGDKKAELRLGDLPKGFYLYRIVREGVVIGRGKLMVH